MEFKFSFEFPKFKLQFVSTNISLLHFFGIGHTHNFAMQTVNWLLIGQEIQY